MYSRFLLIFLLVLTSGVCYSNISEGPIPPVGQITGGPFITSHCTIESELLVVDLRPIFDGEDGTVSATYKFISDTSNDKLQLIFIARNLADKNFSIRLDDQTIHGDTVTLEIVPEHWLLPRMILLGTDSQLVYDSTCWSYHKQWHSYYDSQRFNDYISFTIPVDSGYHILNVTYNVEVPQDYYGQTIRHYFTYILSPASDWKDYNDLNVKLYLPEDWEYQSNIQLKKVGDAYTGYWKDLPADYFYVYTRLSDRSAGLLEKSFLFGLWAILLCTMIWLFYRIAKRNARSEISSTDYWTRALWYMPLATIVFFIIFSCREWWMRLWYGEQLDPGYTHGDAYTVIFGFIPLSILAIAVGYLIKGVLFEMVTDRTRNTGRT